MYCIGVCIYIYANPKGMQLIKRNLRDQRSTCIALVISNARGQLRRFMQLLKLVTSRNARGYYAFKLSHRY